MFYKIFSIFLISSSLTYLLTPLGIIFAQKFNLLDNPKIRQHPAHTHKGTIPRAGGLPIFLGIFLPLFIFIPISLQSIGIFIGAILLILVGIWDDKKDISPYLRFIINVIAALITVNSGIFVPYITNPYGGILHFDNINITLPFIQSPLALSSIIAIIWIVWTTNIVGWSGGIDGQLPGFVSISAIIIGILSLRFTNHDVSSGLVTILSFLTAGAFAGFLPWNFYPQKIMPGYGGKSLAGYLLAVLSILSYSKLGTALLVLAVPMTDAFFVLLKRILSGRSPVWASSGHLHHLLLNIGWSKRRIAIFYWLISLFMGIVALTVSSKQKMFALILILIIISGFLLWINYLRKLSRIKESKEY
jgi:UDP-GlcNAc:undecaprenyl-phosphate/decaprenyl-phosphate GlcNAc-1-phosphate transferase